MSPCHASKFICRAMCRGVVFSVTVSYLALKGEYEALEPSDIQKDLHSTASHHSLGIKMQ